MLLTLLVRNVRVRQSLRYQSLKRTHRRCLVRHHDPQDPDLASHQSLRVYTRYNGTYLPLGVGSSKPAICSAKAF